MTRCSFFTLPGYDLRTVYRSSKLGLYLMSRELARRYSQFDICSLCVDPGLLNTDFYRSLPAPQNAVITVSRYFDAFRIFASESGLHISQSDIFPVVVFRGKMHVPFAGRRNAKRAFRSPQVGSERKDWNGEPIASEKNLGRWNLRNECRL